MDHNYTVTIIVCVISMIILAIDAGKNTIFNKDDIKWFRITFILAALGAICEYLGVLADKTNFCSPKIHWFITFSEFCISPYLGVCLARSSGMKHSIRFMLLFMTINVVIEVISLFTGVVFYIDSNGTFHRGCAYASYLIFCAIDFGYVLFVFILIGIRSKLRYLINILLITSIMIVGNVANVIDSNINSGYLSICVTATLLYICVQTIMRHVMIQTINMEKDISNHDALTKVLSRICFDNQITIIDKEIKADPPTIRFAVCECDLNNLKMINDTFGHDIGDAYIKNCCKAIRSLFSDCPVFRIGGDEFVAIMMDDNYTNLEAIKEKVFELTETEMKRNCSLAEKKSFAAGFAVFEPYEDKCFNDVIKRADTEMYQHKKMLKSL